MTYPANGSLLVATPAQKAPPKRRIALLIVGAVLVLAAFPAAFSASVWWKDYEYSRQKHDEIGQKIDDLQRKNSVGNYQLITKLQEEQNPYARDFIKCRERAYYAAGGAGASLLFGAALMVVGAIKKR